MIVSHNLGDASASRITDAAVSFLQANKTGGFAYLGPQSTRFQGVFFKRGLETYKVIENVSLYPAAPDEIIHSLHSVQRRTGDALEKFATNHKDTLLYEVTGYRGFVHLVLDCRKIYDYSTQGRIYRVQADGNRITVCYEKFSDDSLQSLQYRMFLVVRGAKNFLKLDQWEPVSYAVDKERGSPPYEQYVYRALQFQIDSSAKIVFAYSDSLEEACSSADNAAENFDFLCRSKEKYTETLTQSDLSPLNREIVAAYRHSLAAVDSMMITGKGMYAGYPWFDQVWTRDEAISLKALMLEGRLDDAKEIIFRNLSRILDDGRIPNRFPQSELGSADGVGWVFFRACDFLFMLEDEQKLGMYMGARDIINLKDRLAFSIQRLLAHHTREGLAYNGPLETWMDTAYRDDTREGYRIEIQALRLAVYRLMAYVCQLTGDEKRYMTYSGLEEVTRDRVRSAFWKKPALCDGAGDPTVRPNIFIAYYIYPGLLSRREWVQCFDYALERLWLDWGGISSLDKNHKYFVPEYTGENNRSYHRGDSWFFLNNLAAVSMFRLNRHRYRNYINRILTASTHDILYRGVIGYHSELSSACEQRAQGCPAQCWSSAMYIELINEIF